MWQPSLPLLTQTHTWGPTRNPLEQPFLKRHFLFSEHHAPTGSNPAAFWRTPWCTFPRLTSSSISSQIKSYDEQTVELAAAHRPPPGWLLSTLNFLSSTAQGHMTWLYELCIGSYSATAYRLELSWASVATPVTNEALDWLYVRCPSPLGWEVAKVQIQVDNISNRC